MTAPLIQGASGVQGEELTYVFTNENNKKIYTFTSNEPVSWSINGGEKSLFSIDKDTGTLSFKDLPDYETIKKLNGTTLKFTTNYFTTSVNESFFVEIYNNQNESNKSTPTTANNFLQYVNDKSYDNTLIHRLVSNFIIQGGAYTWPEISSNEIGGHPLLVQSKGEIINEPYNSNMMGTIAMAKISGLPNSATSQWFINLSNNLSLDSQNDGFSVFGHLLGDSIENPLLLNNQLTYNVNYHDIDLNIPELPLVNVQGNVIINTNYLAIKTIAIVNQRPSEIENKFNVIVTASDSDGNKSNQYVIVNLQDIQGEVLNGIDGDDNLKGGLGNDTFQGNGGNDTIDGGADYDIATYSGNFSEYTFDIANKIVTVTDNRLSKTDGIDSLSNIEKLTFADQSALITSQEIKPIHSLGFQSEKIYSGTSDTYKFYDLGSDHYGVGTATGIDELTGESILKFDDKNMNLINDVKATFDQVTGLNTDSGKMFRLYNASFKRLPDPDGLRYWIGNFSSGKDDERAVASSFLASAEFTERYGVNVSNESYVNTLYVNVLDRDADTSGLNYWLGQLTSGAETRYEVLLGFSESAENKALFSEITGLY
ncbi:DUF4214 domain-containing protein [Prochlorococcus marinus]|uniref:DUF4214 domain-containing protein n=1 Tax=Prochlorococcus marinus TaxID=1219 RepID=UPI0022B475AC|nr:DUF4214 domain-containing protein [Prochlorococcus marinus]